MRHKVKDVSEERVAKDKCRHYWIIERASGPTSRGVCKFCGAEKEFSNLLLDLTSVKKQMRFHELPELPEVDFDGEQNKS